MKVDEFMDEDEQDHIEQKRKLGDFDGAGNVTFYIAFICALIRKF